MGSIEDAVRAASWAGCELTEQQCEQLARYHRWLSEEALDAGGVGPNELDRLWTRHIGDSLLFGLALHQADTCADIGSGVGLPGVPLAIAGPATSFDLVDKSGRRCDLLRRAIRVLGLENCHVVHSDVDRLTTRYDAVVSRAAMPLERLLLHVKHLLSPDGIGLVGVTHGRAGEAPIPASPSGLTLAVVSVPDEILDRPVQLLRIEAN